MSDHWDEFGPPDYITTAAVAGFKGKAPKKTNQEAGNLEDLARQFPGGVIDGGP